MKDKPNGGPLLPMMLKWLGLAAKNESPKTQQRREGYAGSIKPKAISRISADISTWKSSLRAADNIDNPKRARLYNLYQDILLDAHLSAQIELRVLSALSTRFTVKMPDGTVDEETTALLKKASWKRKLDRHAWESRLYGYSLVELTTPVDGRVDVTLLNRNNVIPEKGLFLRSEDDDTGIAYRTMREFGTWVLELGDPDDYGLLNKAVPHVLFMRFAQSCWSELCEIYGIPPRYIKTNTQDPVALDRAEQMMRDMGAAAWFIIDQYEEFNFAKGTDTNGDVYKNLINVCKEAISILINGVVMGQDTVNGNRSKEEISMELWEKILDADRAMLESDWNETLLPALERIGIVPEGRTYEFDKEPDLELLWKMVYESMQHYDLDIDWLNETFGLKITSKKQAMGGFGGLRAQDFFA